jgi:hypothetical protein
MGDACLIHGRFPKVFQTLMIKETDRRNPHGSTVPKGTVFKNDPGHLMPSRSAPEGEDRFDRADGIAAREIAVKSESVCDILQIDLTTFCYRFRQAKGHIRIIRISPETFI